jgi:hypothetical protein
LWFWHRSRAPLRVIDARTLVQCDLKALGPALLVT